MTAYRFKLAFVIVLGVCLLPASSGVTQEVVLRKWVSGSHEVDGKLLGRTATHVTLQTAARDKVKVKIEVLSEADRMFLKGLDVIQADVDQLETIEPHVKDFDANPETAIEILEEVSRTQESSAYAALFGGVLHATENGNFRKAKRLFEIGEKRITEQQELMGPSFHAKTRQALLNNIAVCSIYMGQGAQVTRFLQKGFEGGVPFHTYHNANLYLNAKSKFRKGAELSKNTRKKLVKLIAAKPPEGPQIKLPERFLLTTECDKPLTPVEWSRMFDEMRKVEDGDLAQDFVEEKEDLGEPDDPVGQRFRPNWNVSESDLQANDLYPVLWCMKCDGDGELGCSNQCSKGRKYERVRVNAGTNPITGGPKYRWSSKSSRCGVCRGKGHLKCGSCRDGKISLTGELE